MELNKKEGKWECDIVYDDTGDGVSGVVAAHATGDDIIHNCNSIHADKNTVTHTDTSIHIYGDTHADAVYFHNPSII